MIVSTIPVKYSTNLILEIHQSAVTDMICEVNDLLVSVQVVTASNLSLSVQHYIIYVFVTTVIILTKSMEGSSSYEADASSAAPSFRVLYGSKIVTGLSSGAVELGSHPNILFF
jgi:hypothetical protein